MALRALLLSPDDQAVKAITGVLEEMSVSCERPLDGMTAAKKLNSETFDLVLVDCENLPAAKLIFDVCRRSHGSAPVPVAIVEGRVGLPTAFRLGAELILTKPVAKDQARITIRTAVSRVKKDHPVSDAKPAEVLNGAEASHEEEQERTAHKALAQAAAAGAASTVETHTVAAASSATSVSVQPTPANAEFAAATAAAAPSAPVISSAGAEIPAPMSSLASPAQPVVTSSEHVTGSKSSSISAPAKQEVSTKPQLSKGAVSTALEKNEPALKPPVFSSYEEPERKLSQSLLLATLILTLSFGGVYAGWMYQPGFREFIQIRIEQGKALLGLQSARTASPVQQIAVPAPAKPLAPQVPPEQVATAPQAQPASTGVAAAPAANSSGSTPSPNDASEPSVTAPASPADVSTGSDSHKIIAPNATPKSELPEPRNVVILSSRGAERRLTHRVPPVVAAEARAQSREATVVLKAMVNEKGAVQTVEPLEGNPALTDAAVKAVKQWRYKPYTRDGKTLPFQTIVLMDFQ